MDLAQARRASSRCGRLLVCCAGLVAPAAAQIAVTSSTLDLFTNGSCGRLGSTTGLITDDPPPLMGAPGTLMQSVGVSGGPVLPGDLPTLPGTQCQFQTAYAGILIVSSGAGFLYATGTISGGVNLISMDGEGLSASVNATGVLDHRFSLSGSFPYRLTGTAMLDDQDVAGGLRFFRGLLPLHAVQLPSSGAFDFSGMLTTNTYRVQLNTNLTATAGQPDVGFAGDFSEFSNFSFSLVVGCLGVVTQPEDQTICALRTAQYFCFAAGVEDPQYQWQIFDNSGWHDLTNGPVVLDGFTIGNAVGANQTELYITTVPGAVGVESSVRCLISNGCDDIASDPAALVVEPCCAADLSGSSDPNDPTYGAPDGDGDAEDYFYFLDQFAAQNLDVADMTSTSDPFDPYYGVPDHIIDASDFFFYLDLFAAGCP